jgi:hypothetical protein
VIAATSYLEDHGPAAKMPVSRSIVQPNMCGMKELRPGSSGRSEFRILYAFDFQRQALLLLGGDKAERSNDWAAWYDRNVPIADMLFAREEAKARQAEAAATPKTVVLRKKREGKGKKQ